MRPYRSLLVASLAALAFAAPARAEAPDPDDYVTVTVNGFVVCVTEPCEQPPLVEVCVVPVALCVAR